MLCNQTWEWADLEINLCSTACNCGTTYIAKNANQQPNTDAIPSTQEGKSWTTSSRLFPHPFWVTSRKSQASGYVSYLALFSIATSLGILTESITLGSYFPFLLHIWCPSILWPWLLVATRTILDRYVLIYETKFSSQAKQPFTFSLQYPWDPGIVPYALGQQWPQKGWFKVTSPDVTNSLVVLEYNIPTTTGWLYQDNSTSWPKPINITNLKTY